MVSPKGTIFIASTNGDLGSALVRHITPPPELLSQYGIYMVRNADNPPDLDLVPLHSSTSHAFDIPSLDLADLNSGRQTAHAINTCISNHETPPIRALILNAGFQDFGKQTSTADGYDTTLSANILVIDCFRCSY